MHESAYHRDIGMFMFIAALIIIAKIGNQVRCSSANECTKKSDVYTMEFYSAGKRNEIMTLAGKQADGTGHDHR